MPFFPHNAQERGRPSSSGHCSAQTSQERADGTPEGPCKEPTHPGAASLSLCQLSPKNTIGNTSPCLKGHPHKVSLDPGLRLRKWRLAEGESLTQEHRAQAGKDGAQSVVRDPPTHLTACHTGRSICLAYPTLPGNLIKLQDVCFPIASPSSLLGVPRLLTLPTHALSHPLPVRRTSPWAPWTSPWGFPGVRPAMSTLYLGLSTSLSGLDHIHDLCKLPFSKQRKERRLTCVVSRGTARGNRYTRQVIQEHGKYSSFHCPMMSPDSSPS